MIRLVLMFLFIRVIGQKARTKGYQAFRYQIMGVLFWICFETMGLAVGSYACSGAAVDLCGLLGAGLGALLTWEIVSSLRVA